MIVASGDWLNFVKFDPSTFLASTGSSSANRQVLMSSNSPTPVDVQIWNSDSRSKEPAFGAASTWDLSGSTKSVLYKEDSATDYMNSFQEHGGMGVFIGEGGACAAGTPVKTFVWPVVTRICFLDEPFRQVKQLPASSTVWFKGNSGLAASTIVEGIEGNMHMEW